MRALETQHQSPLEILQSTTSDRVMTVLKNTGKNMIEHGAHFAVWSGIFSGAVAAVLGGPVGILANMWFGAQFGAVAGAAIGAVRTAFYKGERVPSYF